MSKWYKLLFIWVINLKYEILKYQRVRDLREDRNLSQEDVAQHLNVSQSTYSRYEIGERNMPLEIISELADFYNTSIDYLVGKTDEFSPYPKSKEK